MTPVPDLVRHLRDFQTAREATTPGSAWEVDSPHTLALHACIRVLDSLEAQLDRSLNVWDRAALHRLLYVLFPAGPQAVMEDDLLGLPTHLEGMARARPARPTWPKRFTPAPLPEAQLAELAYIIQSPHLWSRLQHDTRSREQREYLMTQLQRLEAKYPTAVARRALLLMDLKRFGAAIRLLSVQPPGHPLVRGVLAEAYALNGQPEKVLELTATTNLQA